MSKMKDKGRINVAVVGLEFGSGFIGPLLAHPDVESVGLCDINKETLRRVGRKWDVKRLHKDLPEILESDQYDAVCLFTPIPDHAGQAISVLASGKHVASAVPMAVTLDDIQAILTAQKHTRRNYMMMETAVYSPEFLLAQEMHQRGEFGRIQFLRGYWYNNLENHPRYWHGLPPMHYVTHPLGPILALAGTRAASVVCLGSGGMRKELQEVYRNPWPIETAIFRLAGTPAVAEVTSITVETALSYKETFDLYGDRMTLESARLRDEKHALIRIHSPGQAKYSPMTVMRVDIPSFNGRLPEPLRQFGPNAPQPHLVHEFVRSIVEGRKPWIDAATAASWTAPGICAHQSALQGGAIVEIPSFG